MNNIVNKIASSRFRLALVFLFIAAAATILILVLPDNKPKAGNSSSYKFTRNGIAYFSDLNGNRIYDFIIEIADTPEKMKTGLMYRDSLATNQAMLFLYKEPDVLNFWMKNTYIPLDIVFIGADSTVVSIAENTTPFSEQGIQSKGPATMVLEINANLARQLNLQIGDRFFWKRDNL